MREHPLRGLSTGGGVKPASVCRNKAAVTLGQFGPGEIADRLGSAAFDVQLRLAADASRTPVLYAEFQQRALRPSYAALESAFRAGQRTHDVRPGNVTTLSHAFIGGLLMITMTNPGRAAVTHHQLRAYIRRFIEWIQPAA